VKKETTIGWMTSPEGDIIRTIRQNIQHIGHFHTAGNPGRNELDETQELYYPPIMKAIAATDYNGYVGQEFSPRKGENWSAALEQAYRVCDI
jgi:hydroxypyruvate isomerase